MPLFLVSRVLKQYNGGKKIVAYDGYVMAQDQKIIVQKMADAYNMTVEQVKGALRATDLKDMEGQLKIRKTIDLLVENAKIA